jgi:hypothetical protein
MNLDVLTNGGLDFMLRNPSIGDSANQHSTKLTQLAPHVGDHQKT